MKNTIFPHKFWRPFLDCMPQLFFNPICVVSGTFIGSLIPNSSGQLADLYSHQIIFQSCFGWWWHVSKTENKFTCMRHINILMPWKLAGIILVSFTQMHWLAVPGWDHHPCGSSPSPLDGPTVLVPYVPRFPDDHSAGLQPFRTALTEPWTRRLHHGSGYCGCGSTKPQVREYSGDPL